MTQEKNVICDLWDYLERKTLNKKEQKIFNWLKHWCLKKYHLTYLYNLTNNL